MHCGCGALSVTVKELRDELDKANDDALVKFSAVGLWIVVKPLYVDDSDHSWWRGPSVYIERGAQKC